MEVDIELIFGHMIARIVSDVTDKPYSHTKEDSCNVVGRIVDELEK